jgi:hypothetical protein
MRARAAAAAGHLDPDFLAAQGKTRCFGLDSVAAAGRFG